MARFAVRARLGRGAATAAAAAVGVAGALLGAAPVQADAVAYLVNVTVRPGYNFAGPEAALGYGYGVCDKVRAGTGYGQLVLDLKHDFATGDDYQATYLINQAVNELCPALIWQLRESAQYYGSPVR